MSAGCRCRSLLEVHRLMQVWGWVGGGVGACCSRSLRFQLLISSKCYACNVARNWAYQHLRTPDRHLFYSKGFNHKYDKRSLYGSVLSLLKHAFTSALVNLHSKYVLSKFSYNGKCTTNRPSNTYFTRPPIPSSISLGSRDLFGRHTLVTYAVVPCGKPHLHTKHHGL